MPNIKSAKKRVLITKKETVLNNAIKKVEKAATKEEAATLLSTAIKRIDIAAQKGVIKSNTRDRYKSRLNKIVNEK